MSERVIKVGSDREWRSDIDIANEATQLLEKYHSAVAPGWVQASSQEQQKGNNPEM